MPATQLFCPDCRQPRLFQAPKGMDKQNRCTECGYRARMRDYWNAPKLIAQWRAQQR